MATISTLAVNLVARTSAFNRGLHKSQRQLRAFTHSVGNIIRPLAAIGTVAGTAAAVGLGYLIKREMDYIDTTGKMARRINISTEELVGLQHAAQLSGVDIEGLNKAMETFVRRLGETRMGVGQAQYALDKLGLTTEDVLSMSPAESFRMIADRINGLSNQADKAASAYYLMGRQGMQMLNMMQLGSKGLMKVQEDAQRLGLTFTMQQALQVEAANDALYRMKTVFTGIGRTLAIEISPVIEQLSDRFTEWATSGPGLAEKVKTAIDGIVSSVLEIGTSLDAISLKWKAFHLSAIESKASMWEFVDALTNLDELFAKKSGWTYKGLAEQARQQARQLQAEIDAAYDLYINKPPAGSIFSQTGSNIPTSVFEGELAALRAKEDLRKEADKLKLSLRSPLEIFNDYGLRLKEMFDKGLLTVEQGEQLATNRREELWGYGKKAADLKLSLRSQMEVMQDFIKELRPLFDTGQLNMGEVQQLMVNRARELWDFAEKPQGQFIQGQGMEFDPSRISPAALARSGTWAQSAEVSELKQHTVILKTSNEQLTRILDSLRKQQGWN